MLLLDSQDYQGEWTLNNNDYKSLIQEQSLTIANLTDQIGRQQTHIENLWEEVGFKNEKITTLYNEKDELNDKFRDLYKRLYEKEVRRAQKEKNLADIFESERTDN